MSDSTLPASVDTDRNLLFGVLALQTHRIENTQFVEICKAWASRKVIPLADLLLERGWITPVDRAEIEAKLEDTLRAHNGDAHASLFAHADAEVRRVLAVLGDPGTVVSQAESTHLANEGQPAEFAAPAPAGTRYTRTRLHATGGLGQVWLARDTALGREVALKELRPNRTENPVLWQRFLQEAKVTGQLEHPGIVPVYELVERAGESFYTMRFIQGQPLHERIKTYHRLRAAGKAEALDLQTLLNAFVGVCNTVAYAHARGVVHRDLKPQNIVLGDFGEVILLDWGLAKLVGRETETPFPVVALDAAARTEDTHQGQVLGTPAYMAPEQAEGRVDQVEPRTDVYGLGAILYQILTDQPPFGGTDPWDVLRKVRSEPPARPRDLCPGTPPALEACCLRALAKRPEERYASAGDLARDIQCWLADEPVEAYREPFSTHLRRWGRRHRALVASLAALVVTALVALTVSTLLVAQQKRLAEQERDRANQNLALANENFRLAHQAVDSYLTNVSDDEELKAHDLEPLRKRLLESARDFYERFVQQEQGEAGREEDLARAYGRLAKISYELAPGEQAFTYQQQALQIGERLIVAHPDEPSYQGLLADGLANLGTFFKAVDQTKEAEDAYLRALRIFRQLVDAQPTHAEYRLGLVVCQLHLASLCSATGRAAEAEQDLKQALPALEQLVKEQGNTPRYLAYLAKGQRMLATLYVERGKFKEAGPLFGPLEQLLGRLTTEQAKAPEYRWERAALAIAEGIYYEHTSKLAESMAAYQRAADLLGPLAREHPHVAQYRRSLALARVNASSIYRRGRDLTKAEASAKQAAELLEQLRNDHPAVGEYTYSLAKCYHELGLVASDRHHLAESEAACAKALDLYAHAAAAAPSLSEYQESLAGSQSDLAERYMESGRLDQAITLYGQSADIHERLARAEPGRWTHQRGLAIIYSNLGNAYTKRDEPDKAVEAFGKAIAAGEKLVRALPQVPQLAAILGITYSNLGEAWDSAGKLEQALDAYDRALRTLEPLRRRQPTPPEVRRYLSIAYANRGGVLRRLRRLPESLQAWKEARALMIESDRAMLGAKYARTLASAGDHAKARQEAEAACRAAGADSEVSFDAACVFALSAKWRKEPELFAHRAMTLLKQARSQGCFKAPSALRQLKQDPDLAGLRGRADYQRFLSDLAAAK
jgi:serine/threonine-protein kinase